MILGSNGDILPSDVSIYNLSPYKDYYNPNSIAGTFGVFFGGHANTTTSSGFAYADTANGILASATGIGSRLCFE